MMATRIEKAEAQQGERKNSGEGRRRGGARPNSRAIENRKSLLCTLKNETLVTHARFQVGFPTRSFIHLEMETTFVMRLHNASHGNKREQ